MKKTPFFYLSSLMISSLFSFVFCFVLEQIKELKVVLFGEGLYEEVENYVKKKKAKGGALEREKKRRGELRERE